MSVVVSPPRKRMCAVSPSPAFISVTPSMSSRTMRFRSRSGMHDRATTAGSPSRARESARVRRHRRPRSPRAVAARMSPARRRLLQGAILVGYQFVHDEPIRGSTCRVPSAGELRLVARALDGAGCSRSVSSSRVWRFCWTVRVISKLRGVTVRGSVSSMTERGDQPGERQNRGCGTGWRGTAGRDLVRSPAAVMRRRIWACCLTLSPTMC